jgi:glutamate N-acetyltransferase/amino-acid N-acetyltransferase
MNIEPGQRERQGSQPLTVMSGTGCQGVTAPAGFRAAGVAAGLKASGNRDVALLVNTGPDQAAAVVLTSNRVKAAPVVWTSRVAAGGRLHAAVANSGGANACTGPEGFADTEQTAVHVADLLGCTADEVAVCSTGLIGVRLPMAHLLAGIDAAAATLSNDGGPDAAAAIMTTDTISKLASHTSAAGWSIGGMAKGAGMLAPGLATMLVFLTTDADTAGLDLDAVLRQAVTQTFNRLDSDGCMSTNDSVLLMASGASNVRADAGQFASALVAVCEVLARALIADAEGASKDIRIEVVGAATERDAEVAGRAVARSSLFKCAVHGEDPNWGRILSAVGTTDVRFEPEAIDVQINGVEVCRDGAGTGAAGVDMSAREVHVLIDLRSGPCRATIWTNDLTAAYVHENSAYST